jgi:phasin family protein
MLIFPQSVAPAVRSHLDAQMAFLNEMSKSWTRSLQHMVELNIQLTQTLLEETNITGQQLLTTNRPVDAISAAASRAQPAAEKLRAYQHHISRALADSQAELAQVAEQHVQQTSRTARTLADEVARAASEETQNSIRTQQDVLKNFRDPFQQEGQRGGGNGSAYASGNLQSAGQGSATGMQGDGEQRAPASARGTEGKAGSKPS